MLLTYYTDKHHYLYIHLQEKEGGLRGKAWAVKYSQNFGKSNNNEK